MERTHRRTAVGLVTALLVTVGLLVAPPSTAASKASSSISVKSVKSAKGGVLVTGQKVVLKGTTSKNLRGKRVYVQRWTGKKWIAVTGSAKVSSKATFTVTVKAGGVGTVKYRAVFKGSSKVKASRSKARSVVTYRWTYLSRMDDLASGGTREGAVTIAGTRYANSEVLWWQSSYGSWDLKRKCRSFVSANGILDDEPASSTASIDVLHDGDVVSSHQLAHGKVTKLEQDVTDIRELRIERTDTSGMLDVGLGNARVLCRF